jgi:hypothetical protein
MVHRVLGEGDAAIVVIVDWDRRVRGWSKLEIIEYKPEPGRLLGRVG